MAQKAKVPIAVAVLDYEKKEMGVKSIINGTTDFKTALAEINAVYKDIKGKNPDQFALHSE
jgi:2-methylisocitrate lyase-like PEP mutase family enzyme